MTHSNAIPPFPILGRQAAVGLLSGLARSSLTSMTPEDVTSMYFLMYMYPEDFFISQIAAIS
jgi:hypothetical protein